jgi:hypothetical protein
MGKEVMNWQTKAIESINEMVIQHRNYVNVHKECLARLNACQPGDLVIDIGGIRVGKTRLAEELMLSRYGKLDPTSDYQPYAIVTAANASKSLSFSSWGFMYSALLAVQHPFYSNKTLLSNNSILAHAIDSKSPDVMSAELVNAIRHRQMSTLVFDEMQNTRYVAGGTDKVIWLLESLKSIAVSAGVVLFISTSYELLPYIDRCPQVIARSDIIHFPRYLDTHDDDLDVWQDILDGYSSVIKFKKSESLRTWAEFLYHGSLGCIGLLSRWLRSAVATSEINGASALKLEHLQKSQHTPKRLAVIRDSHLMGEQLLLGADDYVRDEDQEEAVPRPKRRRRPFTRNPRRYGPGDRLRAST